MVEITSVATLLEAVQSTGYMGYPHAHVRVWFRGQGDDSWHLEPGVYRAGFATDDAERVKTERHLTQDFVALSAPLIGGHKTDAEIYFIQQHYRMPTRLLDWSFTPLAALFFALDPTDKDGALYVLDAYQFESDPPGRGLCTQRSEDVTTAMRAIFQWNNSCWPKNILPIRASNIDQRISAQRGCFTFHPPDAPRLTDAGNNTLKKFRIPASAKDALRKELELLGIDEFTIYGDLDHLAARLKRAYASS